MSPPFRDKNKMATPIKSVVEEEGGDEAAEKLLDGNQILVVPKDDVLLSAKSSKKGELKYC